jgi:hypothetical protein
MNDIIKHTGKPVEPGTIEVTVYYQSKSDTKAFKPSDTVEEVLDWGLKVTAFAIDPAMASEFELARHGVNEELPLSEHLGKLATGSKQIAFDLVRGDMANGSAA